MSTFTIESIEKRVSQIEKEIQKLKNQKQPINNKNKPTPIEDENLLSCYLNAIIEIPGDTIIFCIDTNYNYILFNSNYQRYIKQLVNVDIEVGMNVLEVLKNEKNFLREKRNFKRALNGEEFNTNGEYIHDSQRFYYEDFYRTIYDANKKIIGTVIFYTNITARRWLDHTWEILLKISEEVNASNSFEEFIRLIHAELSKLIDTTNFFVAIYDEASQTYTFPFYADQYDELDSFAPIEMKKSLTDYVRRTGEPLLIANGSDKELIEKGEVKLVGTPSPSWLGVPLKAGEKNIGVMVVQSYRDDYLFTENDLELMTFVSDHVALAVQRKRFEEELKSSTLRLNIAQSIAQVGNWEWDMKTDKIHASSEAYRIFGISTPENFATSEAVLNVVRPEYRYNFEKNLRNLNKDNRFLDEIFKIDRKDNQENVVVQVKAELIINQFNGTYKVMGTIQDITKYHQVQEELKRAKEKAEESDKLKSAFLANMSHEIRTPMNAILGFSRLLTNPDLSQNQREEYNEYIHNSGQNLLNLINDIIDVAKIEAGQIMVKKTNCPINKIINELYTTFEKQIQNSGKQHIQLLLKRSNDNPDFIIYSDPFRFRQILANLISNALKFIEKGYIEFGFYFKDAKTMLFYVKDTGIGIPADKMELIFSRFGQIQGAKIKNPGGTGLGLSICKHLIESMGGEIWVESKIDVGTTFFFTLPYDLIQITENETKETPSTPLRIDMKGKRILVVEDNQINRTLLIDTLKHYDKNVFVDLAFNGKEAIELYSENEYDIIIMDIRMPVMDGYQATEYIRTQMPAPKNKIPILGLSAHAMKDEKDKSELFGLNAFITKPFVPEELFTKINELTGSKPAHEPSINSHDVSPETNTNLIDLSLIKKMYQGANDKVNNILSLCQTNIPKQLDDLTKKFADKDWNSLRIIAHSLKSTLNYLGIKEGHEIAKSIEQSAAETKNIETIAQRISRIKNIWNEASKEIEEILYSKKK